MNHLGNDDALRQERETTMITIGSYLLPPNTPPAVIEMVAAQVLREADCQAERDAANAAHEADPIPGFRAEVIDRTEAHIVWHQLRGEERGLQAPEITAAENGMLAALEGLGDAEGEVDCEAASDAAHEALSRWKRVLENLHDGPDSLSLNQCAELDQGDIGSLLRCIDGLDHLASEHCRATKTQAQILLELASELFACPQFPAEEM